MISLGLLETSRMAHVSTAIGLPHLKSHQGRKRIHFLQSFNVLRRRLALAKTLARWSRSLKVADARVPARTPTGKLLMGRLQEGTTKVSPPIYREEFMDGTDGVVDGLLPAR